MEKMKEEYLEIEELNFSNNANNGDIAIDLLDPEPEQWTSASGRASLQQRPNQSQQYDCWQTQPLDFNGDNDDAMLRKLLKKFQMEFIYPFLKAYDISYRSLRYLSVDDINTAIRSVGHRAEFREKLFSWRRKRYRTNDPIIEHDKSLPTSSTLAGDQHNNIEIKTIDENGRRNKNDNDQLTLLKNEAEDSLARDSPTFQNILSSLNDDTRPRDSNETTTERYIITDITADEDSEDGRTSAKKARFDGVIKLREHYISNQLDLEKLVNESLIGPVVKAFYAKFGYLERKHRDELVDMIINYFITKEIKIHASDFMKVVDMIINMFPSEADARDYYFINRSGKRNPMGRLYTKYYNTLKRIRIRDIHQEFTQDQAFNTSQSGGSTGEDAPVGGDGKATTNGSNANNGNKKKTRTMPTAAGGSAGRNTQLELIEDEFQQLIQLDDTSVSAIKNFLRSQSLEWDDVRTMWSKTYLSRQEDIEQMGVKELLQQWPKYLNARGIELFSVDFRLKFSRDKLNFLQKKWTHFAQKIVKYYQSNIRDDICKGLFALWKSKPGKDTENYLLLVLLNSVIIPMARYRDSIGNRRKISIVEAVDLFAIRVTNLEELDHKREEILIKYGEMHSEYTPFIVVLGDNNVNIHEIYVQFDVSLYEMPDFLSAVDACLKIYKVFNLPYPASNEYIWTFIQRYFYDIVMPDDIKCPSMSSVISFLKLK